VKEKARGTREIMAAVEGKMRSAHGNCMLRVDIRHYSVAVDINSSVLGRCFLLGWFARANARRTPTALHYAKTQLPAGADRRNEPWLVCFHGASLGCLVYAGGCKLLFFTTPKNL